MNNLSYSLYNLIENNNHDEIKKLLNDYNLYDLLNTKNNGLISNLIKINILFKNENEILNIINYVESLNDFKLMKRDYINLIKFYNQKNIIDQESLYIDKLLNLIKQNPNDGLTTKDIDFIINNNLIFLLKNFNGIFIETSVTSYDTFIPDNLKLYNLPENILLDLKNSLDKIVPFDVNIVNGFTSDFDILVDAGNILHSRNGNVNHKSIKDLSNIVNQVEKPLIVIHERHCDKYGRQIYHCPNNKNLPFYITPYNYNDDLFILKKFFQKPSSFILTNDRFRDHIFNFTKSKNYLNQFKHFIKQQTIKYNIYNNTIENKPTYSRCIQIIDDNIFIPHINGQFIKLT